MREKDEEKAGYEAEKSLQMRKKSLIMNGFAMSFGLQGKADPSLFFSLSIETKGSFWESKV